MTRKPTIPTAHDLTVAANVRTALQAGGPYTISDLARELDMTRMTAQRRFYGRTPYSVAELDTIAAMTGHSFEWLTTTR